MLVYTFMYRFCVEICFNSLGDNSNITAQSYTNSMSNLLRNC